MSCSDSRGWGGGGGGGVLTPDTNVFPVSEGARSRQSTSAACPWKLCNSCPLSTSHNAHVPSPLDVRIFNTSRQRGSRITTVLKFGKKKKMGWHTAINGLSLLRETSCDQDIKPGATGCCELLTKLFSLEYAGQWFLINESEIVMSRKSGI